MPSRPSVEAPPLRPNAWRAKKQQTKIVRCYVKNVIEENLGNKSKKVILPIPTIKEQKSIVAKLDALSAETKKLETIYQQKLADLEELKKSVLKKAFNGGL